MAGEQSAKAGRVAATSSIMVGTGFLAGTFVCICAALFWDRRLLAAFLLFVFLIGMFSRLWGRQSLRNVAVAIAAESANIFAGQQAVIRYRIANRKFLPLVWLELIQPVPPNGCLLPPAEEFEIYELNTLEKDDTEREEVRTALKKKVAFILWHQTLEWESHWQANRRGIYPLETVVLRSGDGFGLSQIQREYAVEGRPVFVIYPKILPVRVDLFLQNLWEAQSGAKGYFEDPTIIRGERAYQPGDPWKRIDWRMAARGAGLQVKLYETIMPQSVHFILDGGSFFGRSAENEELETAISLLASAVLQLEEVQVRCGLSLPAVGETPASNRFAADGRTGSSDILFDLAGFQPVGQDSSFEETAIARAKDGIGQLYFLTWDVGEITCKSLLDELGAYGVTLMPWIDRLPAPGAGAEYADYRIVPLHSLGGGGGNG